MRSSVHGLINDRRRLSLQHVGSKPNSHNELNLMRGTYPLQTPTITNASMRTDRLVAYPQGIANRNATGITTTKPCVWIDPPQGTMKYYDSQRTGLAVCSNL